MSNLPWVGPRIPTAPPRFIPTVVGNDTRAGVLRTAITWVEWNEPSPQDRTMKLHLYCGNGTSMGYVLLNWHGGEIDGIPNCVYEWLMRYQVGVGL